MRVEGVGLGGRVRGLWDDETEELGGDMVVQGWVMRRWSL